MCNISLYPQTAKEITYLYSLTKMWGIIHSIHWVKKIHSFRNKFHSILTPAEWKFINQRVESRPIHSIFTLKYVAILTSFPRVWRQWQLGWKFTPFLESILYTTWQNIQLPTSRAYSSASLFSFLPFLFYLLGVITKLVLYFQIIITASVAVFILLATSKSICLTHFESHFTLENYY